MNSVAKQQERRRCLRQLIDIREFTMATINRNVLQVCLSCTLILFLSSNLAAQEKIHQTTSVFGVKHYTVLKEPQTEREMESAQGMNEAKQAFEEEITIRSALSYGTYLRRIGLFNEAVEVFSKGLEAHPDSVKLLRQRAQFYVNLRDFDKSVSDGLKAVDVIENMLIRADVSTSDLIPTIEEIVNVHYHLGQAYYGKRDFANAALWFDRAYETALISNNVEGMVASTNWTYISYAKNGDGAAARMAVNRYHGVIDDFQNPDDHVFYFDSVQLFKGNLSVSMLEPIDETKPWGGSLNYPISIYYILKGETDKAKPHLRRLIHQAPENFQKWGRFAVVHAAHEWQELFPDESPYDE